MNRPDLSFHWRQTLLLPTGENLGQLGRLAGGHQGRGETLEDGSGERQETGGGGNGGRRRRAAARVGIGAETHPRMSGTQLKSSFENAQ